ncbi:arsenic transporter [Campylobacter sp. CCS1377]|uniref:Arsenic transporter n=1 Tax=Campylobacter sp. CCS1377 TaxID=3158229 RepID=A0AAU7E9Y9_9BACT
MLAWIIFLSTLILLFWRPWNLPIWSISILGAFVAFVLGIVNFNDVYFVFNMIWDSSLSLIGLIILSFSLEALGFFDKIAFAILQSSKKDQVGQKYTLITYKFMIFIILFTGFLATFFANDGAILIITPIILALFSNFNFKNEKDKFILITFLLIASFACDFLSNTLVISNLTNIITTNYFKLSFLNFAFSMLTPNVFACIVYVVLSLIIAKIFLPKELEFEVKKMPNISQKTFIFCFIFLTFFVLAFFVGEFLKLPISVFSLGGALVFLFIFREKILNFSMLRNAPWGVLIFSFGLYVVVYALHKEGLSENFVFLLKWLQNYENYNTFALGFISAFGSAIFNNLPMVMIGDLALKEYFNNEINYTLIYAHLLGCNIGAKLTPIGSLATLLWLGVLSKQGVKISIKTYFKFSIILSLPVLFSAILGLLLI